MALEKLFENIDSTILTDDVKASLQESFDNAVNEKVDSILSEKMDDLEQKAEEYSSLVKEEYENKLNSLDEKVDEYTNLLQEEYEEKLNSLDEKAEEYIELYKDEMNEKVSEYLDRAVQEFIQESKEQLCINVDNAKAEALTEAYSKFALMAGVEVSDIAEAYNDTRSENRINSLIGENDQLVNENLKLVNKIKSLNEKIDNLMKLGLIKEMTEGMSLTESRKFERLAELVEFTNDGSFVESLEKIRDTVKKDSDDNVEDQDDSDNVNESVSDTDRRLERLI